MKKILLLSSIIIFIIISFLLFTRDVLATSSNDTLVGYWKFDEATAGSTVNDSSGNANNGTPQNSPFPSTNVPYTTFPDVKSLNFNGSNQFVSAPTASSLNFAGSFTIAFWMNPTSWNNAASAGIVSKKLDSGGSQPGYVIYDDGSSSCPTPSTSCQPYINIRVKGTSNSYDYLYSSSSVNIGGWQHWTVVYDSSGQTLKWYKNGVLDKTWSSINIGDTSNSQPLDIGFTQNWSGYYNGKLDDLRMYKRALSSPEIAALAAGNHTSAIWTGGTSTDYEIGSNWDIGAVPDPYTLININSATNYASLSANESFAGLNTATGGILSLAGFNATMNDTSQTSGLATSSGTLISKNSETVSNFTWPTTGTVMYNNTSNATGFNLGNTFNNLILNDGLVGYWKLDESISGSTAIDSSGYGNNAKPIGTSLPSPTTDIPGVNFADSHSIALTGSNNDYLIASNSSLINLTNNFSISAWIKPSSFNSLAGIVSKYQNNASNSFFLRLSGTSPYNKIDFGGGTDLTSTTALSASTWYNVVAVDNNGTGKIYINGTLDSSGSISISSSSDPVTIGVDYLYSGARYFNGNIDDVRIYNRVLSSSEITNLANGNEPSTSIATTTLNNNLTVNGTLTLSAGTLDAASANYNVTVGSNFENDGGIFTARNGTVNLNGTGQSINSSNTFYNLTKLISSADTVTFGQGSITTITNTLTLQGALGNFLALRSSTNGTQFKIDPQGIRAFSYLNPQDSNNVNATTIAYGSTFSYGTNLTNWATSAPTPSTSNNSSSSSSSSSNSSTSSCTTTAPTSSPDLFQVTTSPTTATLYFTPITQSTGYVISYGITNSANEYSTSFNYSDTSGAIPYTINNLNKNTTYYFKVQGVNGCQSGIWSQTASGVTTGIETSSLENVIQTEGISPSTNTQTPQLTKKITIVTQTQTAKFTPLQACAYTVQPGDSLWSIAQNKLGDGNNYQTIINQNLKQYSTLSSHLSPGMQLQVNCPQTPQPQPLAKTTGGYDLAVQVENNGKPVAGAVVELHSVPMRTITDKNGIARFTNVEGGHHVLALAYNGYKGQDKITVNGNKKDISINISIKLNYDAITPIVLGIVIAVLFVIIGILCFLLFKKRKLEKKEPNQI